MTLIIITMLCCGTIMILAAIIGDIMTLRDSGISKEKLKLILAKYYCCDNSDCGDGAICNYCALREDIKREIEDV